MKTTLCAFALLLGAALPAPGADIRIAYWYNRGRPLDTFKFQAYDLRKKEFSPDAEAWLTLMKQKFPAYEAYTRDVDLSREKGETDKLKIGSAITREFIGVGSQYGYSFGVPSAPDTVASMRAKEPVRPLFLPTPRYSSRPEGATTSSPFPIPYVRPHP